MGKYYSLHAVQFCIVDKSEMKKQLLLSKLHLNEGIRIYSQIYGPSHQQTTAAKSQLSTVLMELSRLK
jgi:hypothetical protein